MMCGRILCVTSNFPRWTGDSTTPFVLHLAQDLQQLGWHIDILAPHAEGTALRETLGGVQVERFRYLWPSSLETVCYQGGALINLRKNRTNYLKLPALISSECLNLFLRLKGGKYDLLHSHWILPQGFTGILTAGLLRIPHVTTVHGGDVLVCKGLY
jgi:phosphatidylinositol alpha-1,6-mannosyltransferase